MLVCLPAGWIVTCRINASLSQHQATTSRILPAAPSPSKDHVVSRPPCHGGHLKFWEMNKSASLSPAHGSPSLSAVGPALQQAHTGLPPHQTLPSSLFEICFFENFAPGVPRVISLSVWAWSTMKWLPLNTLWGASLHCHDDKFKHGTQHHRVLRHTIKRRVRASVQARMVTAARMVGHAKLSREPPHHV